MNVHIDKVHWMAGDDLKTAGVVAIVGIFLYLIIPILSILVIVLAVLMAARTLIGAEQDLGYIDYVLKVED